MDGIELIRKVRDKTPPSPIYLDDYCPRVGQCKELCLRIGRDDFIAKPLDTDELLSIIKDGLNKNKNEIPAEKPGKFHLLNTIKPPFTGVVITASTGGPPALTRFFRVIGEIHNAAFFIVQHGPPWMLETFAKRLQNETKHNVKLAKNGMLSEGGIFTLHPVTCILKLKPAVLNLIDEGPESEF